MILDCSFSRQLLRRLSLVLLHNRSLTSHRWKTLLLFVPLLLPLFRVSSRRTSVGAFSLQKALLHHSLLQTFVSNQATEHDHQKVNFRCDLVPYVPICTATWFMKVTRAVSSFVGANSLAEHACWPWQSKPGLLVSVSSIII